MPKVSVIIPAYNPSDYLRAAFDSVARQSFTDWELLIVDDGSEPPIEKDLFTDPRVCVIRQEHQGVSAARNLGILNSTCPYIALLDADDAWFPDKLKLQVQLMDSNPQLSMCHTGIEEIDECGLPTGNTSGAFPDPVAGLDAPALSTIARFDICTSAVMIRRDRLPQSGLFEPAISHSEDYDLYIRLCHSNEARIGFLSQMLTHFRRRRDSASANYRQSWEQGRVVLLRHMSLARRSGDGNLETLLKILERRLRRICSNTAIDQARLGWRNRAPWTFISPLAHSIEIDWVNTLCHLNAWAKTRLAGSFSTDQRQLDISAHSSAQN